MSRLLDELPAQLDFRLELNEEQLTLVLPASALRCGGFRTGESFLVDVHPLSLRLEPLEDSSTDLPSAGALAHVAPGGLIHLPFQPPRLPGPHLLLQLRHRGTRREIHLIPDPQ